MKPSFSWSVCFLQRSKEVINTGDIPNTKIQAISRGLKRKRKLGKRFLPMCSGVWGGVLNGFQTSCQSCAQVFQSGIKVGNCWRRNWKSVSRSVTCAHPAHRRELFFQRSNHSAESNNGVYFLLSVGVCFSVLCQLSRI